MVLTLVDKLCLLFNCDPIELGKLLINEEYRPTALENIRKWTLYTLHLENNIPVKCDDFTYLGTNRLLAYGGYLNITLQQHLYVKYHVQIRYPFLPCVVQLDGLNQVFYPLEKIVVYEDI